MMNRLRAAFFPCLMGALFSGIAAGIAATLVQIALWSAFTEEFPAILFRDARLTAALVLGRGVLPPPATFDLGVWVAATLTHFLLSILYAALIIPISGRFGKLTSLLAGAGCGLALYAINLYGFTAIFPWFAVARGWITVAAHVAFGVSAVAVYGIFRFRNGRSRSSGR